MSAATASQAVDVLTEPPAPISAADAALAERERALPGFAALLDEAVFTTILDQAYPEAGVRAARARYLRLKPSTNCLVAYDVEASAGATRVYARTHPRYDADKLARVKCDARAAGPLGRGGVLLEDLLVAVYPFPNDRRLPVLANLFEDEGRSRLLSSALGGDSPLASAHIEAVGHKPERRFVGLLEAPGGERAVLKAFDRDWARASAAAWAAASTERLRVPRRLGASAGGRLLVTEWLRGKPLDALARAGAPAREAAAAAGRALADLHAHPAEGLAGADPGADRRALGQAAHAVASLCPSLTRGARTLAERLAGGSPLAAGDGLVHGDFSADQVLVAEGEEVSLIDLDEARRAPPAVDLGSFLARLELDGLEGRLPRAVANELGEGLLAGYEEVNGTVPRGVRAHAAGALLRLAPEPFRQRRRDWPEFVTAALERAGELEGGDPPLGVSGLEPRI